MKALLICPGDRQEVASLAESAPLCNLPILGKSLVEYWLEHLVKLGATQVLILASDRPEQVRAFVGNGARWGLSVAVHSEIRELTAGEARIKYCHEDASAWLPAPNDAQVMECLPGLPERPLLTSYADWVTALEAWMPRAVSPERIGAHQLQPGVWVGMHVHISPHAELRAPCWLGDHVYVGSGSVIGPMAVLEQAAFIEGHTEISHSVIGPETFVGKFTEVGHSIAWGSTLVDWKLDSCIKVPDAFLLCSLGRRSTDFDFMRFLGRVTAVLAILLTFPLALYAIFKAKIRRRPALRAMIALRPGSADTPRLPGDNLIYYEFTGVRGALRRWPQLWSVVLGEFSWIGNRPLSPRLANTLAREYERLWLAAPLGLISLADAEGCTDFLGAEMRAHASYYAARANWRLDVAILCRVLFHVAVGFSWVRIRDCFMQFFHIEDTEERKVQ